MRFFADDLSVEIPVEWYYVPEDRPHVPYAHPFVSSDGDEPGIPRLLGEVPGTRSYYAGNHENDLLGQGLCGSKEQWENGPSILDSCLPTNPTTGRQCCCGKGQLPMEAGLVMGAALETEFPPEVTGCVAANPAAQFWRFEISGVQDLAGPCNDTSKFNQVWTVDYFAGCIWRGDSNSICSGGDSFRWFLMFNHPSFPGVWSLFAASGPTSFRWARYEITSLNPIGGNILDLVEELDPGLQFPSTVHLIPTFG